MTRENAFLTFWFDGFTRGLDQLDDTARHRLLAECGRACAASHTRAIFCEAWAASDGVTTFLERLEEQIPHAAYRVVEENLIEVVYTRCACELVVRGLVTSPSLCLCSAYTLEENFKSALKRPVRVSSKGSLLAGDPECRFHVRLEKEEEISTERIIPPAMTAQSKSSSGKTP